MHQCGYCTFKSNRKYNLKIHEQRIHTNLTNHAIQSGFGSVVNSTTHIPIEKHNEALDLIHKLKALWRNSKKEKIAYEEHRREDGEHTLATITYLENVLNANNIRYNLDLA